MSIMKMVKNTDDNRTQAAQDWSQSPSTRGLGVIKQKNQRLLWCEGGL